MIAALIDHWLDGKNHSRSQHGVGSFFSDISDPWVLVKLESNSVSANLTNHGVAVFVGMVGYRLCNIPQEAPRLDLLQSQLHALFCHLDQIGCLLAHLTDAEHTGGVGIIAIVNGGNIHIDNISFL